ncbi:hypothetical protein [Fusobacterium sp.]|uniref:hypothetical protein n=1 Tax=Fusobacterium sp. TaxID=68766 RepID=UPI00261D8463|nr:hypothetical protein [Fusobacterium sp.]
MKKMASALFFLITASVFAGHYDKEENMIENKLYNNFPVLEEGKNINIQELEVDIEKDGRIEVEIEFTRDSQIDKNNYKNYADKVAASLNEILKEMNNQNFVLTKIEIDTSGISRDKEIFRY